MEKLNFAIEIINKELNKDFNFKNFDDIRNRLIFLSQMYNITSDRTYLNKIEQELKEADSFLRSDNRANGSLWNGFSGLNMIDMCLSKVLDFEEIHKYIKQYVEKMIEFDFIKVIGHREYDIFYGICGISQYLLDSNEYSDNTVILTKIFYKLKSYILNLDVDEYKNSKLLLSPNQYYDKRLVEHYPNGYIDLGMAHGLLSILVILQKLDEFFGYKNIDIKNCINIIHSFYMNTLSNKDDSLYWKKRFCEEGEDTALPYWCYGDLTIAYVLSKSKDINQNDLKILKKVINQFDKDLENLTDYSFCHGLAGAYYILSEAKKENLITYSFKKEHEIKLIGYIKKEFMNNYKTDFSILTGGTSIILALLTQNIKMNNNIFSKFLLLE